MHVAHIQADYELGICEMPVPSLPPKGALIKVIGCGLCGSDLYKLVHKKGSPGNVLGHEVVGIIDVLDDDHPEGWKLGNAVVAAHHVPCGHCHFCLNDSESMCAHFKTTNLAPGGFSQYIALTEGHLQHTTFRIPQGVSFADASCVEPLACVLRAVRRGNHPANASVVVVGLGFIGMMAAQLYQNDGFAVYGVDLAEDRNKFALQHGLLLDAFHPLKEAERLKDTLSRHTQAGKVDTVFLTTVNPHTVAMALELVRDGGTIILFTSATPDTVIDPSQLYFREINLITSYSPGLSDLRDASQMIFKNKIQVAPLISHQMPLSDIQNAVELYRTGQALKVFVRMEEP